MVKVSEAIFLFLIAVEFRHVVASFGLPKAQVKPFIEVERALWRQDEENVVIYRIPLLSYTPSGHLLAVAEARKYSHGDAGQKFMVIRRSVDELGDEWEPTKVILDDGYLILDGLNLGNVIVDDEKGIIFIMYSVCFHHDGCSTASTMLLKSTDDGITWSRPVNVSQQIGTWSFAPGPGFGIQKKLAPGKGRLVSCGHGGLNTDGVYCLLSDDHGLTWKKGGYILGLPYNHSKKEGDFVPDECQAVELDDGSVMVNARNQYRYKCSCRIIAYSYDGGETILLNSIIEDHTLIEPACAAGLVHHRDMLFFSNPRSESERINLTLQWSYNNGTTWTGQLPIWPKASGYSTMTAHPGSSKYVFIAYEKGFVSTTESISFVRVGLYDSFVDFTKV